MWCAGLFIPIVSNSFSFLWVGGAWHLCRHHCYDYCYQWNNCCLVLKFCCLLPFQFDHINIFTVLSINIKVKVPMPKDVKFVFFIWPILWRSGGLQQCRTQESFGDHYGWIHTERNNFFLCRATKEEVDAALLDFRRKGFTQKARKAYRRDKPVPSIAILCAPQTV